MQRINLILYLCLTFVIVGCSSHSNIDDGLTYDEYVNRAQQYIAKGDSEKAISSYKKALTIRPNNAQSHFNLGKLYKEEYARTYELAQKRFQSDVLTNQNNHQIKDLTAELQRYGLKSEYEKLAMTEFRETIKSAPDNSAARYYIAVDYFNNKKYTDAIDEFKRVVELNPKNSNAYHIMGDAHLAIGSFDLALNDYKRAYENDSDNEYYYYKLGRVYVKMNDGEKTAEMFQKLKDMKSSYADRLMTYKYYPKTRD